MIDKNDIIEYIISMIGEFAKRFNLSEHQAYLYLKNHDAIQFIEQNYRVMHTLDDRDSIEGIVNFCRRSGGLL